MSNSSLDSESERPRPLSLEKQKKLDDLKKRIHEEFVQPAIESDSLTVSEKFLMAEDSVFLRFLRAKRWNVKEAFDQLITAGQKRFSRTSLLNLSPEPEHLWGKSKVEEGVPGYRCRKHL